MERSRVALGRLLTLLAVLSLVPVLTSVASVNAEEALPSVPLPLFGGGTLDLRSLQGNVVVIRFLASW
jgi:hypothetical protein